MVTVGAAAVRGAVPVVPVLVAAVAVVAVAVVATVAVATPSAIATIRTPCARYMAAPRTVTIQAIPVMCP
jgi:hypothetical protein